MREVKLHLKRAIPLIIFLGLVGHFILPRLGTIEHSASIIPTMLPWALAAALAAQVLSYVSNGAVLQCTFGMAPGSLTVLPVNRVVHSSAAPQATIMDFAPMVNISSFGMCQTPSNPLVAAATAVACLSISDLASKRFGL